MKKVILITGASSGMGKDAAEILGKRGHKVYAVARSLEKMEALKPFGVVPMKMDITKKEDVDHVLQAIKQAEGRLDVLVNNAGFGLYGAVEDIPIDDVRYQFEVNLFGLGLITQKAIPLMRENGSGSIINISSMGGKMYTPLGAWYHATKHALEGWSDCLRVELKSQNIHVAIIEPGVIETNFAEVMEKGLKKYSGEGQYAEMTRKVVASTSKVYEPGNATPSQVLGEKIAEVAEAKKPKTRYVKGKMAKPLIWVRKYLGDRVFDKGLELQM